MAKAEGNAGSGTTVEDVKLHIAALQGNCSVVSNFIGNNINRAITDKQETILHIATLARQDKFVEKLVSRLKREDLELVNVMGSNPLCYAAISGSVKIAKHMVQAGSHRLVNPESGVKPLLVAASVEHGEMVRYLFDKTDLQKWNKVEQAELFTACIYMGLYVKGFQVPCKRTSNQSQALELLGKLFSCALSSDEENPLIRTEEVENLLYEAAEVGNVDFLIKLIQHNPQLVWAKDEMTGSIFHIAVKNRHENIFSLLFQLGAIKDIIAKIVTSGENNLLHIAAKLAPQDKLNNVRPTALKIQRELLWFKVNVKLP
ncbi:hypothetical protein FEM48_Zijuj07G0001900 [Ziziphus jujuba var. spinosa]|uniref:Uncharacterized protein n=1 Tax=Ziziphus jujuba var. spinosa TaxID=714518 RepID=A0A978V1A9_ZIZJJ|nr:hypothetical protein FEM48_Zijuj07G0001900 [Ziziphus jujuba var. spinosa]